MPTRATAQSKMHLVAHDPNGEYQIEEIDSSLFEIEGGYYNGSTFRSAEEFFGQDELAFMEGYVPATRRKIDLISYDRPDSKGQPA